MAEEWVEVRDEPRHRRRFEDGLVRVYDVLIPPGDTTLYHRHTEDTFYVAVNEATVRNQRWQAPEARPGTVAAGVAMCLPHRAKPLTHQVQNVGDREMRLIGAEIRDSPAVTSAEPLSAPGHTVTGEHDRLRVYELALEPGATTGRIDYGFTSLTVFLTIATLAVRQADGSERTLVHAPGDVLWLPAPTAMSITNVGEEPFRAAVGEWR